MAHEMFFDKKEGAESSLLPPSLSLNPLKLFEIAKSEGRPLYTAAPMVRYSKLAFRETVAQYGVDLTWTPMILAKEFNRSQVARESGGPIEQVHIVTKFDRNIDFSISPHSPPTILQLGVNSALEIYRTTMLLAPFVNGIDINCGCPQSWACAETLGAALMQKPDLVASLITSAKLALRDLGFEGQKTVSVKIRVHRDLKETLEFVKIVEAAGVDFITVHGRLRSTPSSQPVNLDAIKFVKDHATVPVLANGDVFSLDDAKRIAERTGVDGVMTARGLLQNPALFHEKGKDGCPWEVVEIFLNKVARAPLPFKLVVHHLGEMCGTDHTQRRKPLLMKEERLGMMDCKNMMELLDHLDSIRKIRRD